MIVISWVFEWNIGGKNKEWAKRGRARLFLFFPVDFFWEREGERESGQQGRP